MAQNKTEDKPTVSVLLPTYNEAENIIPLIRDIDSALDGSCEIIVIDDDSPDKTWQVVQDLRPSQKNLRLIRRTGRRGLVSALKEGISAAQAEMVAWMDCDFSHPPQLLKTLVAHITQGYDMAVGSRFVKGGGVEIVSGSQDSVLSYILSLNLNRFIQKVLGSSFKDYTSGFLTVKKNLLFENPLQGDYGEYFIALVHNIRKRGFRIVEIPYISPARQRGTSKTGTHLFQYLKRGTRYLSVVLKLGFSRYPKNRG